MDMQLWSRVELWWRYSFQNKSKKEKWDSIQKGNLIFYLTSELTEVLRANSKTEIVVVLCNPVKILGSSGISYNENEWSNHETVWMWKCQADPVIEPVII